MRLEVYKGFNNTFYQNIENEPLVSNSIDDKTNVLVFDRKKRKQLEMSLIQLEDDETVWVTYEEYSLIKNRVDDAIKEDGLELVIFRNNMFPDYYPLSFAINDELAEEIYRSLNTDSISDVSEECRRYLNVYNALVRVGEKNYGCFYNYEYDTDKTIENKFFYPENIDVVESIEDSDIDVFINDDIDTYLRDLDRLNNERPSVIGVSSTGGLVADRILKSLKAYCIKNNIRLINFHEPISEENEMEQELISIAKNDINIQDFEKFRTIKFYKNPDLDKEVVDVSQSTIIQEIIQQAVSSYDDENNNKFRDIFITASTGAGKSVMFQVPAVYLAKKYNKLTIIIEPVKALMQDQKEKLVSSGYKRVEAFNSDLISQVEKEAVLKRVKEGEIDLLYLSPETLLSYSIETIIGDREIGLLIVDEAHTVTSWGMGFRPDYWYLGGYINRLRNQTQTKFGLRRKIYHFPICAFTATAINGGIDDSVSDTVISLYMENPIKYIGYVRRDDISFNIKRHEMRKLGKDEYEKSKTKDLNNYICKWLKNKEKTIVYFPYATYARDAKTGVRGFTGIITDKRIGMYTGKNVEGVSDEVFKDQKKQIFSMIKDGSLIVMLATKAFGMGVDVDDVENVYHYAVTGNLCDYVQEIGRAARKKGMNGLAITDFYYNDLNFMNSLFGMSQIKQYQVRKVLEGVYETFKSKKEARSFLISPQSFTYIFNGKGIKDDEKSVNKLKTCLLMLEKDFYDKYNFKVLISRPQSVFTKAFVVVQKENEEKVLKSKYGKCFKFIAKGRYKECQGTGEELSDMGDVYLIDLKQIWEEFNANISFPQFKYWYFNSQISSKSKLEIMPEIRDYFSPRQKVSIEVRGDMLLSDLRERILEDFEYITNIIYATYGRTYFTTNKIAKLISERYGMTKSRIIANSIFDLVDPDGKCVKHRINEKTGENNYNFANGNFKEFLRRPIIKSKVITNISMVHKSTYSSYMSFSNDVKSNIALKLLSIFDYISYEIVGGSEPEIFIRLNDPNKVRSIVMGDTYYSNNYVSRARQKHDRDLNILIKFFKNLASDKERWDYIENYFLGYDVLETDVKDSFDSFVDMKKAIDKEHCYPTNEFKTWSELNYFFDENDHVIINKLAALNIPIPEYLETQLKKSDLGEFIMMSWPSKNILICNQDTTDGAMENFRKRGWFAYRIYEVNYDYIKGEL